MLHWIGLIDLDGIAIPRVMEMQYGYSDLDGIWE